MFSPMPPLVDQPAFIPPPQGATNGGESSFYNAFPGYGPGGGGGGGGGGGRNGESSSGWAPPPGTPYPSQYPNSPFSANGPPNSAASWSYGTYVPAWGQQPQSAPAWAGGQTPAQNWGQTPATSWGTQTPGGTWGAPSPASYGPPQTPAGYSPYMPPNHQQQGQGTWITPNMNPNAPPAHGTPYDSSSGQPITAGWFGGGGGNVGHTGYPDGNWSNPPTPKRRSNSIKRSHSQGKSPRRTQLQRSSSWGEFGGQGGGYSGAGQFGFNVPPYAHGDLYDERNLSRRPRDWRPDYDPRPGLASYIPRVGKNRSDVREYIDMTRRTLHPLLHYNPSSPPIYFNLIEIPFHTSSIEFLNLSRPHNEIDFAQLSMQPSCAFLRLYHARLPWYIDIYQVHPNGITVMDVLTQIHAQLHTPIHGRHFWNEDLNDSDRAAITKAFQQRCRGDQGLVQRGVVQLDFLGPKIIFEGLVRGPKGLWEMKLAREQ